MDHRDLFQRQTRDVSPGPDPDTSALRVTVIPQVQMPEDLRSEFLPGDVILINEPRPTPSAVKETLSEARRRLTAVRSGCPWCRVEDACKSLAAVLAVFAWLGVRLTSVVFAVYMLFAMSLHCRDPSATRGGRTAGTYYHGIGTCCSRDVGQHWAATPARWVLSPSTFILLQQPMLNLRSLVRYHRFFTGTRGRAAPAFEEEVDGCMRYCAAEGRLPRAALSGSGTQALLRLERYRDRYAHVGLGLSWASVLYQNYRDWKRWRLANVVCERVQGGENRFLPLSVADGQDPLDGLEEGRGDHMWFVVQPKLFSSRLYRERDH